MTEPSPERFDQAELLNQTDWIRALARRLVYDPGEVDDVIQDTWVALIRRPPLRTVPLRRWVAAVVQNVARQRGRGEGRRRRREQAAASNEAIQPTDAVVARAEAHRAVVTVVLKLAEPYRTTVLLRYFDALPPRSIAKRMGCPVATVHTRLNRATRKMRGELDQHGGGDGRAWLSLLAPLLLNRTSAAAATAGVALIGAAAVAVVGVGIALWNSGDSADPVRATAPPPRTISTTASVKPTEEQVPAPAVATLTARIVDGAGQPIADAQVWALRGEGSPAIGMTRPLAQLDAAWQAFQAQTPRGPDMRSDADGRFTLVGPRARALAAGKPGYQMVRVRPPFDGIQIVLSRLLVTKGAILGPDGAPIADARVTLVGGDTFQIAAPIRLAETRTDERGRFSFPEHPGGIAVWIEHPDHPSQYFRYWDSLLREMSRDTNLWHPIRTNPWATASGQVVSEQAGEPVVGAYVAVTGTMGEFFPFRTRTDAQGRFTLRYSAAPERGNFLQVDAGDAGASRLLLQKSATNLRIVLGPAVAIRGRITGAEVHGAHVYVLQQGSPWRSGTVQADGSFSIRGVNVTVAAWVLFDPWHPEWEDRADINATMDLTHSLVPPASFHEPVVIDVRPKGTLRGRIRTPSGEPVRGARLEPIYHPFIAASRSLGYVGVPHAIEMGRPNEKGEFVWRGVTRRLQNIPLRVRAPGHVNRRFDLPAPPEGAPAYEVIIEMQPGRRIEGRVRYEDGTPAPNIRVQAGQVRRIDDQESRVRQGTQTDADGRFVLDALTDEAFHLSVSPPSGWLAPKYRTAKPDGAPVEFILRKGAAFTGIVQDELGKPIPGASVMVSGKGIRGVKRATARADGTFRFEALKARSYELQIWARGFLGIVGQPLTIPTDRTTITLQRGLTISGTVTGHDGKPVARVLVSASRTSGAEGFAGRHVEEYTDEQGRYKLAGLSAGRFRIVVRSLLSKSPHVFDVIEQVESGTTRDIRGRLGLYVSGVVRDANGDAVENATVEAFPSPIGGPPTTGIDRITVRADEDGRYRLGPLLKGTYDLLAFSLDRTTCGYRWDVESHGTGIDVTVGTGRALTAQVLDHEGEPADANVLFGVVGRPRWQIQIFAQGRLKEGRFKLAGLPPGKLRMKVVPSTHHHVRFRGEQIDPKDGEHLALRLPKPD